MPILSNTHSIMKTKHSNVSQILTIIFCSILQGCTYTVNSLVDAPDANPGDYECARQIPEGSITTGDDGGKCTLRAAIEEANATIAKDTIIIPPGQYNLVLPSNAGGGTLEITKDVDILGSEATTTIIDAGNTPTFEDGFDCVGSVAKSVFYITDGDVFIRGITVKGGGQQAGGGIRIDDGTVDIRDAVIRENYAFTGGGGIYITGDGTANVRRSSILGNCATGGIGGGIWNQGSLSVRDSTIANNESNRAGGILNSGIMSLRNTTVSGNLANSDSAGTGGISQGGSANLNNVTITNNTGFGNDPASFRGGGIQTVSGEITAVKNSIIAGNHGGSGPDDCVGELSLTSKDNLIGNTAGCEIPENNLSTYLLNLPPQLGPLTTNNGGSTLTHTLLGGPAIDAKSPTPFDLPNSPDACEKHDQRGVPRPQGEEVCDMGAVEVTTANGFIMRFVLVDAGANIDIGPLLHGDTLNLSKLPPELSIRVDLVGSPESVVFGFDNDPSFQIENNFPYALEGDGPVGDYNAVSLSTSTHTITATPFAGNDGSGAAGGSLTVSFDVQ